MSSLKNKYARNKTYRNSANSDVYIDVDNIPRNLNFRDMSDLQKEINRYHSLAKVIHINVNDSELEQNKNNFIVKDKVFKRINNENRQILK